MSTFVKLTDLPITRIDISNLKKNRFETVLHKSMISTYNTVFDSYGYKTEFSPIYGPLSENSPSNLLECGYLRSVTP